MSNIRLEQTTALPANTGVTWGYIDDQTQSIYGAKTFNNILTTKSAMTDLAYNGATLDNTVVFGTDPGNHGITRLYVTNATAGFSYLDINIFTNNSYVYIGRLTNPRSSPSYPNQWLYNYHLQRNIRFIAANAEGNVLETWAENDYTAGTDLTGTASTINAFQRVASGGIVGLGKLTWICEDTYVANPAYHSSGFKISVMNAGSYVGGLYIDHLQKSYLYNTSNITFAGTVKGSSDFLTITNSVYAADMDGTATNILFKQYANDAVAYNSGILSFECETDWTSTASTRDSAFRIQSALDGTLTTIGLFSPTQGIYLYQGVTLTTAGPYPYLLIQNNNATRYYTGIDLKRQSSEKWFVGMNDVDDNYIIRKDSTYDPFVLYTDGSGTYVSVRSASSATQSSLALYSGTTQNWFVSSINTLSTPNNRLAFIRYNGATYDELATITSTGYLASISMITSQSTTDTGYYWTASGLTIADNDIRLIISAGNVWAQKRVSGVWGGGGKQTQLTAW